MAIETTTAVSRLTIFFFFFDGLLALLARSDAKIHDAAVTRRNSTVGFQRTGCPATVGTLGGMVISHEKRKEVRLRMQSKLSCRAKLRENRLGKLEDNERSIESSVSI